LQLKELKSFMLNNNKELWSILAHLKDEKLEEKWLEQWKTLELLFRALGNALVVYKEQEKQLKV